MTVLAGHPLDATRWIERVVLAARDPDRLAEFYAELLGLDAVVGGGGLLLRTCAGRDLVQIVPADAPAPDAPMPGLFHTAFLLPDRGTLGSWLARALAARAPLMGASDHGVSEALYLSDPEGNGIEVYADRPVAAWHDPRGRLRMPSEPLDLDALLSAETGPYAHAPEGTAVGHVHLSVPDLAPVEDWARGAKLAVTTRYPGAVFLGWDGYHHQVAANVWQMRGAAPVRAAGAPGLAGIVVGGCDAAEAETLMGIDLRYEAGPVPHHGRSSRAQSVR